MYHHTDLTIIITCNYNNVGNNHNQHKSATVYLQYILKLIYLLYFTILYWFCHTSTWIRHGCTCVPHPESLSHLPPHIIPLGHPSAPAPSFLYPASNVDWRFVSYMILYMFQCHSPKSSHPRPLPLSPKDCSIHLCLFCCLAYRVIVTNGADYTEWVSQKEKHQYSILTHIYGI